LRAPVFRSVLHGLAVTLAAPLWLRGVRLDALIAAAPPAPARRGLDPRIGMRAGQLLLRGLARLPGSPWRDTCLYRALAACVLLRRAGTDARLRIGVARPAGRRLQAHAWVVDAAGAVLFGEAAGRPLEPVARGGAPAAGHR
jgi:hypothetical protein